MTKQERAREALDLAKRYVNAHEFKNKLSQHDKFRRTSLAEEVRLGGMRKIMVVLEDFLTDMAADVPDGWEEITIHARPADNGVPQDELMFNGRRFVLAADSIDPVSQALLKYADEMEGQPIASAVRNSIAAPQPKPETVDLEVPVGAIENGRILFDRVENMYGFWDKHGHYLGNCQDWHDLKKCFEALVDFARNFDITRKVQ